MGTKAQHATGYERLPPLLRALREGAGLTQRELGERLGRPQSWVYNCETGNRRVDVSEFAGWAAACGVGPAAAFDRFLAAAGVAGSPAGPEPAPPRTPPRARRRPGK